MVHKITIIKEQDKVPIGQKIRTQVHTSMLVQIWRIRCWIKYKSMFSKFSADSRSVAIVELEYLKRGISRLLAIQEHDDFLSNLW